MIFCVANQGHDYWLLSDAIVLCIHFVLELRCITQSATEVLQDLSSFTVEASILKLKAPTAAAALAYVPKCMNWINHVHDEKYQFMLSLMLDPRFLSLDVIWKYRGRSSIMSTKKLVKKYYDLLVDKLLVVY